MASGGTINITNRIEMDGYKYDKDGSINMLYVKEYEVTPFIYVISKLKDWEIEKKEDRQISNENNKEIKERNKIMRDSSLDIAMMVAYQNANKKIEITNKKNIVIATTEKDNSFLVGDIIIGIEDTICEDIEDIRNIISTKDVGEEINFKIIRNNKEKNIISKVILDNDKKAVGVIITTEYEYNMEPEINVKFKKSEIGSSGGLMLTLSIYNAISDEDIIKGRNIAGTGTISIDGSIGEIDGIKYKIMGANKNKMDIVFVPSSNYEEAIKVKEQYNYKLDIIKVDNFTEAIEYLKNN